MLANTEAEEGQVHTLMQAAGQPQGKKNNGEGKCARTSKNMVMTQFCRIFLQPPQFMVNGLRFVHNSGVFLQFLSVKMIGKTLIVIVALLVASAAAFRAPLSSRYSTSKSSLTMSKGSTAAKVATGK